MDNTTVVITIAGSLFASVGFWQFLIAIINNKGRKQTAEKKMLLGLAHEQIMRSCEKYIDRGYITPDEYEDLYKYLYEPYKELGGNGSAERMINAITKLPMHN